MNKTEPNTASHNMRSLREGIESVQLVIIKYRIIPFEVTERGNQVVQLVTTKHSLIVLLSI